MTQRNFLLFFIAITCGVFVSCSRGDGDGSERASGSQAAEERSRRLRSLPYLSGYEPAETTSPVGVVKFDPEGAAPGYNLIITNDRNEARLFDMQGEIVHRWTCPFDPQWFRPQGNSEWRTPHDAEIWRSVQLLPQGDLIAMFPNLGIVRLDRDSQPRWHYSDHVHHFLMYTEQGETYVLARQMRAKLNLFDDLIVVLDDKGQPKQKISIYDCIQQSEFRDVLQPQEMPDALHTNSVRVLDGALADRIPAFRQGNLLVSLRNLNAVCVIDVRQQRVVWAMTGPWIRQHDASILDNGNLLVFDNVGAVRYSRVLEVDPVTRSVVNAFAGSASDRFLSGVSGACRRLNNGNTLIVSSTEGRVIEMTLAKEIVWDYRSPHRTMYEGELHFAIVHGCQRIEADRVDPWLPVGEP